LVKIFYFYGFTHLIIQTVKSSVKDINVSGLSGLNLHWEAPFKIDDYIIGFNFAIDNLKTLPQSIFAKKTVISEKGDGATSVELEYTVPDKILGVDARWVADKGDLEVTAYGTSKDRVVDVGISNTRTIDGKKVKLDANYNIPEKKLSGSAKVNFDATSIEISADTVKKDPKLKVVHKLNSRDSIEPTVTLKSRKASYGWKRKWDGGSVEAVYFADDRVDVTWKDEGANGVWTTKAKIPTEDTSKATVTFSRDWKY
jgi:hypothetical protein